VRRGESFAVRTDRLVGRMREDEGRGKQGGWIAGARIRGVSIDHRGYVLNNLSGLSVSRGEVRGYQRRCQGCDEIEFTSNHRKIAINDSERIFSR